MRRHPFRTISLATGLVFSTMNCAQAQVGITGQAGTTGAGVQADFPLRRDLDLRLGANFLNHSSHERTDSLDYRTREERRSAEALLDWYPLNSSGFRLSGGLVYQRGRTDAVASPVNGVYTVQGHTYNEADTGRVSGVVSRRRVAPYLGLGWGNHRDMKKGWSVSADVGVLIQGTPNASLTSEGCVSATAPCGQLAADLDKEKATLTKEVGRYKTYPVLRIGLRYQF